MLACGVGFDASARVPRVCGWVGGRRSERDPEGVFVRGADGSRLPLTSTLADHDVRDGASLVVTVAPKEAKVAIRLSDAAGNELDMVSNNTVKVAKLLATWIAHWCATVGGVAAPSASVVSAVSFRVQ